MKKISFILILISLFVTLALPQIILALTQQDVVVKTVDQCKVHKRAQDVCGGAVDGMKKIDEWPMCCVISSIYRITDWIFFFLMAIVVIMVLFGAFSLLTAGGEPDKISKGRNYILWAAIGFIVALLAWTIPGLAKMIMGLSSTTP